MVGVDDLVGTDDMMGINRNGISLKLVLLGLEGELLRVCDGHFCLFDLAVGPLPPPLLLELHTR